MGGRIRCRLVAFQVPMLHTARELTRYRGLIGTLISRELKARYRGSVLGFPLVAGEPALLLSVYTLSSARVPAAGGAAPTLRPVPGDRPLPLDLALDVAPRGFDLAARQLGPPAQGRVPGAVLPTVPVLANLVHFLLALPVLAVAFALGRRDGLSGGRLDDAPLPRGGGSCRLLLSPAWRWGSPH